MVQIIASYIYLHYLVYSLVLFKLPSIKSYLVFIFITFLYRELECICLSFKTKRHHSAVNCLTTKAKGILSPMVSTNLIHISLYHILWLIGFSLGSVFEVTHLPKIF